MSELNIYDRGVNNSNWTSEKGQLDRDSLHKVMEQRTDNSSALNALPTPFARFFVVKEAFRRMYEQRNDAKHSVIAGTAYERLVSDCLDIFELLYNQRYHEACSDNIVVREWLVEENMPTLKEKTRILHDAIENYISDDLGEDTDKLYFVILLHNGKEYLLGTSSPFTGFVTPPDLDKSFGHDAHIIGERYMNLPEMKRKGNHGKYFRDICLLENRSPEFKNYMYNILLSKIISDNRFVEICSYIRTFENDPDIKNNFKLDIEPYKTEEHDEMIINGLPIYRSKEIGSYFTDTILRVPFKISRENYRLPIIEGNSDCDYLLPLSEEAILRLNVPNLNIKFRERSKNKVVVILTIDEKEEKKEYVKERSANGSQGEIIDLSDYKTLFDLALFPNIKSKIKEENNYYKLMIVTRDESNSPAISANDITCNFYENGKKIDEATGNNFTHGVKPPIVRSLQKVPSKCSTKYFELFNTEFDLIHLCITIEGKVHSGILVPLWIHTNTQKKKYIYAVDLGTTNTFISRRENSNEILQPEQLRMDRPIMSYLHAKNNSNQKKEIDLWEDASDSDFAEYFQTEFIPPYIDGERYKFPIRTAMSRAINQADEANLFGNRNIAFSYSKRKISGNNEVITDIKWDEDGARTEATLFIRELLMLIKYDMLQENADLQNTQLIWFRPLSLKAKIKKLFADIWTNQSKEILGISSDKIKCYTESEAPYYYYSKKDSFKDISSVALIDIGGGSTDIVYFEDEKPLIANSVHFGCDVLWGNGHNGMKDAKENGIYQKFKDNIRFDHQSELSAINAEMQDYRNSYSTKEIINFWLSNQDITNIAEKLRNNYAYLFLYHYAAIIFYLVKMIKSKLLKCPRAIVFSGNGSRYIDDFLTDNNNLLSELTMIILEGEFPNTKSVQLILEDNRKESTCYGGLYCPENVEKAEPYVFMGVNEKQYENVAKLKEAFDKELCQELEKQIKVLNNYYLKMLPIVIKEQGNTVPVDKIKKEINTGIVEKLRTDFTKEIVQKYDKNMQIDDTLFFLPIIDAIYNLTKIQN